jgi:Cu/Ag efflux protein CusF
MKKVLMIALAVLISVAFVTTVFAQEKKVEKPAAAAPAAPEKAKAEVKKEAPKAKAQTFKGDFVSFDEKAKTVVAKNEKGEMTFDVSAIKKMPKAAAGDKVTVVYTEKDGKMVAKSVKVAKAKKVVEKKEEVKKEAPKKEEKPAAAAAPAAPAAPAKK